MGPDRVGERCRNPRQNRHHSLDAGYPNQGVNRTAFPEFVVDGLGEFKEGKKED